MNRLPAIILLLLALLLAPFSAALPETVSVLTVVDACSPRMSQYHCRAGNLPGAAISMYQASPPQWRWINALSTPDGLVYFSSRAEAAMPTSSVGGPCGYMTILKKDEVKKKTATVIYITEGPRSGKMVSAEAFAQFLDKTPGLFAYPVWATYGSGKVRVLWVFFLGRNDQKVMAYTVSVLGSMGFTPVFPHPLSSNDPKSLWREMAAKVPRALPVRPLVPGFGRSGSFMVKVSFIAPETLVFDEDDLELELAGTTVYPPMPGWTFGKPRLKGLALKDGRVTADVLLPYTAPSYISLLADRSRKHSEARFSGGFRLFSKKPPIPVGPADEEGLLGVFLARTFSSPAMLQFSLPLTLGVDYRVWPLEILALLFWGLIVFMAWREFHKSPPDGMTLFELKSLGKWFIALGILGGIGLVLFIGGYSP